MMTRPDPLIPAFPLLAGRVHEAGGPAAVAFAGVVAAQTAGQVLWVQESWQADLLNPLGLRDLTDPARLILVKSKNQIDSLAVAEEALKDGAIALVVIEITRPLNLREGRRLQLAAQSGASMGLCLIPEGMGSNAAESRWDCRPVFDTQPRNMTQAGSTLMQWQLTKNKKGTLGAWHVRWDAASHRLDVVSPVGFGPGAAAVPD